MANFMDWFTSYTLVTASQFFIVLAIIFVSFIIFGMTGFGTALIASPLLALFIPIAKIVPMLALVDFIGAIINFLRDRKSADITELKRLIPLMICGSIVGATILLNTHPRILVLLLSLFAIGYAIYALFISKTPHHFRPMAVWPFGLVGGVFSALFGSGGFIYAMYLNGRLSTKNSIRITLSVLLSLSTLTRAIIFLFAGVYSELSIPLTALLLLPAMVIGIYIGRHITLKMSHGQFKRIVNCIILASGLTLLIDYFVSNS